MVLRKIARTLLPLLSITPLPKRRLPLSNLSLRKKMTSQPTIRRISLKTSPLKSQLMTRSQMRRLMTSLLTSLQTIPRRNQRKSQRRSLRKSPQKSPKINQRMTSPRMTRLKTTSQLTRKRMTSLAKSLLKNLPHLKRTLQKTLRTLSSRRRRKH